MADVRPIVKPAARESLKDTDGLLLGAFMVLVEQASSLGTPPSGYAYVYAKADGKLYFKNDAGTETALT